MNDYDYKINKMRSLGKDKYSVTLIKAIEDIFAIDYIAEKLISKSNNDYYKKACQDMQDSFRLLNNFVYFEKELKIYCGFKIDEELPKDIIFEYFFNRQDNIELLQKKLISLLNESTTS